MTLPADVARCPGREWEECASCRRRKQPRIRGGNVMSPPLLRDPWLFWCTEWLPSSPTDPGDAGAQDDGAEDT